MKNFKTAALTCALTLFPFVATAAETNAIQIEAAPHSARIVSCAIRFPIDSVRFAEEQISKCMASVKLEAVSYIHIIATADASGSLRHNLYLSTRRAGAIESYFVNHYPHIQVHAFGGGVNPKFGKLARIFIVEHQGKGEDTGVQVASIGTPEIIERTKTEFITKTEYRDRPKAGIEINAQLGPGFSTLSDDVYDFVGFEIRKTLEVAYLGHFDVGLRHRLLQSNEVLDINSTTLLASRDWVFATMMGHELFYGQSIDLGQLIANGRSLEWGLSAALGMQNKDYKVSVMAAKSNYLTSIGFGLGVRL